MHITHFTTECKFAEQIRIIQAVSPGLLVHHHLHYVFVQTGNQALLVPLGSENLEFKSNKIKFVTVSRLKIHFVSSFCSELCCRLWFAHKSSLTFLLENDFVVTATF